MATITLEDYVEDYIGAWSDNNALTEWLTSGARFIVDLLPRHILEEYATTVTVTTSGLSLATYRVLDALKNGYEATRVPVGMKTAVQDSNSIHYALAASPVSLIYNGKIYIYPNGGEVLAMSYPAVNYNDASISSFPTRMKHGVILYAAIQAALSKANSSLANLSSLDVPEAPDAPDISFSTVSGETITLPTTEPSYTPIGVTDFSTTNISSYISSEEDLDKAQVEINHQRAILEKFQTDLYNELNDFNEELEIYKAGVQEALEEARLAQEAGIVSASKDLEADIADYQLTLGKYQNEINSYATQINTNVNLSQSYLTLADKLKVEFSEFINGSIRSSG